MFSSIRNFLSRHRRKFLVTGIVAGSAYLITNYAQRKLREWQEKETRKFLEMTRKKQHFESTERTCNQTILTIAKVVCDSVLRYLNTDEIVKKLQDNPENKLELWEQLKVMIFTRICVLVYSLSIVQVILRVQLNVIGGYLYKDSVHNDGTPAVDGNMQSKYLSLCHHFVSRGIEDLCKVIESKVKTVVEPISLKKKVNVQEIEQIFWSIQSSLCTDETSDPIKKMVPYLIGNAVDLSEQTLDTMVKETMDLLESDEVMSLAMSSVSRSFASVVDEIATLFVPKPPITKNHLEAGPTYEGHIVTNGVVNSRLPFVDVNKEEMHLVKLLPLMNDLNVCKDKINIPDLLIQQLTLNEKLKILGANIYEVFSNP